MVTLIGCRADSLDHFLLLGAPVAEHGDEADNLLQVVVGRAAGAQVLDNLLVLLGVGELRDGQSAAGLARERLAVGVQRAFVLHLGAGRVEVEGVSAERLGPG